MSHRDHIYRREDKAALRKAWRKKVVQADEMTRQMQLQKKNDGLEISQPNDHHEQEADAIARKVVNGGGDNTPINITASDITNSPQTAQRKEENNITSLMAKSEGGALHGTDQLQSQLESSKGSGQSLDDATKSEMETKMNTDLSDVKIHTDSKAHEMSEGINAKAFTHGQDIYFKQGNFDTSSDAGKELLAHELVHTQQQRGGVGRMIQRVVEPPTERNDFTRIDPVLHGTVIPANAMLLESIEGTEGIEVSGNQLLAVLYESTDKLWYFAEVPMTGRGYIPMEYVKVSTREAITATAATSGDKTSVEDKENADVDLVQDNKDNDAIVAGDQKKSIPTTKTPGITSNDTYASSLNQMSDAVTGNKNSSKVNSNTENVENKITASKGHEDDNENKTEKEKENENEKVTGDLQLQGVADTENDLKTATNEISNQTPVTDIQAEIAKLRDTAQQKKQQASQVINKQVSKIKRSSAKQQASVSQEASEKKALIASSYDNTILSINTEVALAYSRTYSAYTQQKQRIIDQKNIQLDNLEKGTAARVAALNKEGQALTSEARNHGTSEVSRIKRSEFVFRATLDLLIEGEIKKYNVPDREERMRDRMGALRDEAMKTVSEQNEELIEQVEEDAEDLEERIQDQYEEAAEDLPKNKMLIHDNIEAIAEDSLEQIESILLDPLESMKQNATDIVAQLKTEKQLALDHVEKVKTTTIAEILKEEANRISQLQAQLSDFKGDVDRIVKDVEEEVKELPNILAGEFIGKASTQIEQSYAHLSGDASKGAANLIKVFEKAATSAIDNIDETHTQSATENIKTKTEFRKNASEITNKLVTSYTDIGDKASTSMATEVTEYMKQLDKTVADSIAAWRKELMQGKKEITAKVNEVISKNQEIVAEGAKEMREEAEQTATEYEATYWARRTWEAVKVIAGAIWWLVKWIVKIIVAIILIIIAVVVIYIILEILVEFIIGLLRKYLPTLMAWIERMVMRYVWPFLQRMTQALVRLLTRFIKSKFAKILARFMALIFGAQGLKMIWDAISREDLAMSERVEMAGEGIFLAGTSLWSEWATLQKLFRLSKGYLEFRKVAGIVGDARLAAELVNAAKGDLALALELAQTLKPGQIRAFLLMTDDALVLKNTLALVGNDALKLEMLLLKCENFAELNKIIVAVGNDVALAEKLLVEVNSGKQVLELLNHTVDASELSRLLGLTDNIGQLELYLLQAGGKNGTQYLEELLTLAGPGNASRLDELMSLVNGSSAFLQRLANTAKNFKNLPAPAPTWPGKWRFKMADMEHFLERHTMEFFNFAEIKNAQGFWPAGTTPQQIMSHLDEALELLKAEGRLPKPPWGGATVVLSNGINVRVGIKGIAGTKNMIVGQFFPIAGPEVITLYKEEMLAIQRIFIP